MEEEREKIRKGIRDKVGKVHAPGRDTADLIEDPPFDYLPVQPKEKRRPAYGRGSRTAETGVGLL